MIINSLIVIFYVIFAVGGSTLIKYGSLSKSIELFTLPIVNVGFSWVSLIGIFCYGVSFLLYILLLSLFDLSFISPITIGIVYVLLMVTAVVVFKEHFTVMKTIGCAIILAGILMILAGK